jgi:hypothetical protein
LASRLVQVAQFHIALGTLPDIGRLKGTIADRTKTSIGVEGGGETDDYIGFEEFPVAVLRKKERKRTSLLAMSVHSRCEAIELGAAPIAFPSVLSVAVTMAPRRIPVSRRCVRPFCAATLNSERGYLVRIEGETEAG